MQKMALFAAVLSVPVIFSNQVMAQTQVQDTASTSASQSYNNTQVILGGQGSGKNEVEYSGGYSVKSNPDVVPPMLPGGANPCVVGASIGGSVVGFGMSGGAAWNDVDCERRNLSIVFLNAAKQFEDPTLAVVGIEILCNNSEVADAMSLAGRPCLSDSPRTTVVSERPSNSDVGSSDSVYTGPREARINIRNNQTASNGSDDFSWIANAGR